MQNSQFVERTKAICKSKKIPVSKMLSELNISKSFIHDVKNRNVNPSIDKIIQIAEYLDVSIDYLVSGKYFADISEEALRLLSVYNDLGETSQKQLMDFADTLYINAKVKAVLNEDYFKPAPYPFENDIIKHRPKQQNVMSED